MNLSFQRIVDLSVPLEETPSERVPVSVRYVSHKEGAGEMCSIFGAQPQDLPHCGGWAGEELRLISHAGTHVDAPWHYGPMAGEGCAAKIDELPLDWFLGPAAVLDFSDRSADRDITVEDLKAALNKSGAGLNPGSIAIVNTGAQQHWGDPDFAKYGAGLTSDAVLWLCGHGVRVIGTDSFSLDPPFELMRDRFASTNDPRVIWPAHFAGHQTPYCQIEKLTNLNLLPPIGSWVACFPVKIAKASAAWTRAVAFLP